MIIYTCFITIDNLAPIAQLIIGQQIIDQIVHAVASQNFVITDRIIWILVAQGSLYLITAFTGRIEQIYDQIFRRELQDKLDFIIAAKAAEMDVARFEDPEFYNTLDKLEREGSWRIANAYSNLYYIYGAVLMLTGSVVLFLQLPLWVIVILTAALIPTFAIQTRYNLSRHKLDDAHRTDNRLAYYYEWEVTHRQNVNDVKASQLGSFFVNRAQAIFKRYRDAIRKNARQYIPPDLTAMALATISRMAVISWLVIRTIAGKLTLGQFTLYNGLMNNFAGSLRGLLLNVAQLNEQNPTLGKLEEYENSQPVLADPKKPLSFPKGKIVIRFNNVSYRYPGQKTWSLRHINFEIQPGEHVALVGFNGAGKTTAIKLLCRFYDPTEGSITLNGIDLRNIKRSDLYNYLAVMFQDFGQFQAKVKENIAFTQAEFAKNTKAIEQAGKESGSHEFVEKLEGQYDSMLSREYEGGIDLSGGQWQKIGLARAFYHKASLYILDEPTAALDADAEEHFYRQFLKLEKHVSAILISHRFSTVRMADKIIFLKHGKVQEIGSHDELIRNDQEYARLFRLQAKRYQ